ncbi:efflux RND transporter periplasmic adaptor subunit [Pistricoccus aurantiacus]|uniref:Efflux RND transporter periplasmic adaptor subunit n=1 Tax=Pistricoccus aurantiacus TaxID=1883414 RepID=A0A5B8STK8_9GAMM|nr:efflux RND transporter periplasmic adaptor subunit [Pistricoccus aurantiacus]QEA39631.1 efflux RND transporter periplasmic adaptor subunit [Pistricoccus aurantiacus]
MLKKLLVAAIGVALVIAAIVYTKFDQFGAMGEAAENMVPPPETVTAMRVDEAQWEQLIPATASVSAVQGVTVSAEIGGRVTRIGFESGALTNAGDVLLQLDTASEAAQLAAAEAAAALARADFRRARALSQKNAVSREAVDRAEASFKEAVAQVDNMRALIAKKTVRAPFSGRLGLRLVNLGQVLREGDAIASLQTLDPIYVDFSVPQQQIHRLKPGLRVRVTGDAAPGETFEGEVLAINPEVDPATRNVRVRARVANPDEALYTGMFVNVAVVLPETQPVLPVVATAVLYAPYGDSVFVVENRENAQSGETERVLRQQFVRLGRVRGDFVDVTDGLTAGETVVTSGVFKLRSGMPIVIDNTLAPKAELEPHPAES